MLALLRATAADPQLTLRVLKCCRFGCFMHESNRQAFVKGGLIGMCLTAAETHFAVDQAVTESLKCLKILTKDDDPRVPFGKGNDHASMICKDENGLERLLKVLGECYKGEDVVSAGTAAALFSTLSMLVRLQ